VCIFYLSHTRLRVHWASGIPHALRLGGSFWQQPGRVAPRGCERMFKAPVIARSPCDEAIQLSLRGAKAGLLRGACHRARVRATRWLAMTISFFRGCLKSESEIHTARRVAQRRRCAVSTILDLKRWWACHRVRAFARSVDFAHIGSTACGRKTWMAGASARRRAEPVVGPRGLRGPVGALARP
jgi:hypothetical protein